MAHIIETPRLGWCWECGESWTPGTIVVRLRSNDDHVRVICGACIARIAKQVEAETDRRNGVLLARHGSQKLV